MEEGYGKCVLLAPWGPRTRRFLGTGWVLNTFCPFARPGTDVQWHLHQKWFLQHFIAQVRPPKETYPLTHSLPLGPSEG